MADDNKEDLMQLVKRFGAFLTAKISRYLGNLDSRSVVTIAGLAFTIVFTWRMLRTPSTPQQRQPPKRRVHGESSSSSGVGNVSSEAVNPLEDSKSQNVVDDLFQPAKRTLGQVVRQRLAEGRKVTCSLLGVILEESSPEELQKNATVRPSVVEVLLEITKSCDLYLMEMVLDDESEAKILKALEDAGVFTSGGLLKDKVLFCSTENGRASFVRQLEPDWHIDSSPEIITQLSRFIKYELYVSPAKLERPAPNVLTATSLENFFA